MKFKGWELSLGKLGCFGREREVKESKSMDGWTEVVHKLIIQFEWNDVIL